MQRGFTIIEILTVIAIIGVLASIAITAGRGIQERGKIAKAKAEMAVLAAALEQYKAHYGDYPLTPDPHLTIDSVEMYGSRILFNALSGSLGPACQKLPEWGRSFVELSKFALWNDNLPDAATSTVTIVRNSFADPWKTETTGWYYYVYKKSAGDTAWKNPSFLLYSHGPDGACDVGTAETSGFVTDIPDEPDNADNVVYGRD